MALTSEEIVHLYEQRKISAGPLHEQMRRVRDLANGDIVIPLNELDKNARSSVANLLVQGLDQMSMRVASTMPTPYFPPMREGSEKSKANGRVRKNAMMSIWDHNRMNSKLRRRARHLLRPAQWRVFPGQPPGRPARHAGERRATGESGLERRVGRQDHER